MDKDLDRMVDADIEDAIIKKHEQDEGYCCAECQGQAAYYLRKGN